MANFAIFSEPTVEPKYQIIGADAQIVNVRLGPRETVFAEKGTMMHHSDFVSPTIECFCDSRCCSGESCLLGKFTNSHGSEHGVIGLTPWFPGKIIPIHLPAHGGAVLARKGSYMAHFGNVDVETSLDCNCCLCCCDGVGFVRQELEGDGTVFIAAGGTVLTKVLASGETLIVDTHSVVAWEKTVTMGIRRTGGCCTMCFSGEGLFNTTLTGPGYVVVESMPFSKFKKAVAPKPPPPRRNNLNNNNNNNN
jgi:uncharacterized protein (AIM24 family)